MARNPIVNPREFYQNIVDSQSCTPGSQIDSSANSQRVQKELLEIERKKLALVKENLADFDSRYLISKLQYEKMEAQIAKRIEQNDDLRRRLASGEPINDLDGCGEPPEPSKNDDFRDRPRASFTKVRKHCQAHFDLMAHAFATDYTRSITFYPVDWAADKDTAKRRFPGKPMPDGGSLHRLTGHAYVGNPVALLYHERLSTIINDLVNTLQRNGTYEDTMIVVAGEFSDQYGSANPNSEGGQGAHRADNSPWLIINSGAPAQDYNLGKKDMLHIGDVHLAIMHRMGLTNKTEWGTKNFGNNSQLDRAYQAGKRRGDTRLVRVLKG